MSTDLNSRAVQICAHMLLLPKIAELASSQADGTML